MNLKLTDDSLWFYQKLDSLGWPRSYFGKIFLIAFLTNHVPLLALIAYLLLEPGKISKLTVFWLVLLATLTGTTLALWALHHLLKPVRLAKQALGIYFDRGQVLHLPTRFRDEVGSLLKHVSDAIQGFEQNRTALEQLAAQDFLTCLPNRRTADNQLEQSLSLAIRTQLPLCIALLDVDYFKRINDTYGHAVGDHVLVRLAKYLTEKLRGSDWVARWGGEEFLIVLFADGEGTRSTLERIRTEISKLPVPVADAQIGFTVSIGFTLVNSTDKSQACLQRADAALYQAKHSGRNRVEQGAS